MSNTHMSISMFDAKVTAEWADHIDKVVLEVDNLHAKFHWQQSIEEATALRDQLTAAIEASNGGAR